jgi:hypothetical protein
MKKGTIHMATGIIKNLSINTGMFLRRQAMVKKNKNRKVYRV